MIWAIMTANQVIYCVSQKKQAPTHGMPSYELCFEEACHKYLNNLSATTFRYHLPKRGFIWWDSFVVTTSNVKFDARPILQLSVIALCAVSQPLNRKITKMVVCVSLRLKSHLENLKMKIITGFC